MKWSLYWWLNCSAEIIFFQMCLGKRFCKPNALWQATVCSDCERSLTLPQPWCLRLKRSLRTSLEQPFTEQAGNPPALIIWRDTTGPDLMPAHWSLLQLRLRYFQSIKKNTKKNKEKSTGGKKSIESFTKQGYFRANSKLLPSGLFIRRFQM